MITLMGRDKVYTVLEVRSLINTAQYHCFVDALPSLGTAKANMVYWVKQKDKNYTAQDGKEYPVAQPFVKGVDANGLPCWYTSGGGGGEDSYEKLKNLPSINGEKFLGDMTDLKARGSVSADGVSGGYDFSIHDDEIVAMVAEEFNE